MLEMPEALRPSKLFALRWRSFDNQNRLESTETVYRRNLRPFGKNPGGMTKVHLPGRFSSRAPAMERRAQEEELEVRRARCICLSERRRRFYGREPLSFPGLKPLAEKLEIPKLNFQILRRTMATQAQRMVR